MPPPQAAADFPLLPFPPMRFAPALPMIDGDDDASPGVDLLPTLAEIARPASIGHLPDDHCEESDAVFGAVDPAMLYSIADRLRPVFAHYLSVANDGVDAVARCGLTNPPRKRKRPGNASVAILQGHHSPCDRPVSRLETWLLTVAPAPLTGTEYLSV